MRIRNKWQKLFTVTVGYSFRTTSSWSDINRIVTLLLQHSFVFEDGQWEHHFSQEEMNAFMPIASYHKFVVANAGDIMASGIPADEEAAVEDTIRGHYEAIGDGDFERTYSYFGPTFRSTSSEENWISSERSFDIPSSSVNSIKVEDISGDTVTATVDVSFEDNTSNPRFIITWRLVKENGEWKLDKVLSSE